MNLASRKLDISRPDSRFRYTEIKISTARLLHNEMRFVDIDLALTTSCDLDQSSFFQFFDEFVSVRRTHTHVTAKPILALETAVVLPCVMQEQCIGDLREGLTRCL
jgi:hypothetical protein